MATRLIKSVINELKTSHPSISTLSTLSPIPDFKDWLRQFLEVYIHINIYIVYIYLVIQCFQSIRTIFNPHIYTYIYIYISTLSTLSPIPDFKDWQKQFLEVITFTYMFIQIYIYIYRFINTCIYIYIYLYPF
jgi:hypothetical protein